MSSLAETYEPVEKLPSAALPDETCEEDEPDEHSPLPRSWWPNVDNLVTEDDTPVDNIFCAKQQRLLVEPLYGSWAGPGENRPFLADANVALYASVHDEPVAPDAFLSLDVRAAQARDLSDKRHRSYLFWEFGKPPEVVIEVVSNQKGGEADRKLKTYARFRIPYYVIYDPFGNLGPIGMRVFSLTTGEYVEKQDAWFPEVCLGLTLWHGEYDFIEADWLRWCDQQGHVILTGGERAEQEHRRAERLAAMLRALGVDPEAE